MAISLPTTPEQRQALEAKGWEFYDSQECDECPEAGFEDWRAPSGTIVRLFDEQYFVGNPHEVFAYSRDPEDDSLIPGALADAVEFAAILNAVPEYRIISEEAAKAADARLHNVEEALRNLVEAIDLLRTQSEGVAGLHRNGDIATWDELLMGGSYEDWLKAWDEARMLLDRLRDTDATGPAAPNTAAKEIPHGTS